MSGKGSKPRPYSVNRKTFDKNWDNIFKRNTNDSKEDKHKKQNNNDLARKRSD